MFWQKMAPSHDIDTFFCTGVTGAYLAVLQALLIAFRHKEQAGDVAASTEPAVAPPVLDERFQRLLQDAASAVRSGRVAVQASLPRRSDGPAASPISGPDEPEHVDVPLTVENVGAVEEIFDTSIGASVENEQLCRVLRAATTATKKSL